MILSKSTYSLEHQAFKWERAIDISDESIFLQQTSKLSSSSSTGGDELIKLATFYDYFFSIQYFYPIEVNHIRNEHLDEYNDQNFVPLTKDDISRIQLNLDDELENFTKFKGQVRKFTKKKVNPIQYVDKKIVKRGALLEKDGQYFISPIAFLALVSHTQTSYFSQF